MGNYLVRFLGGEEGVSLPIYPVLEIYTNLKIFSCILALFIK